MGKILPYLKIARFDHWIKQLFIIPGMVFAFVLIKTEEQGGVSPIIRGFIAACCAASANYIINEWLDAGFDQYHPTKKNRPVVEARLRPGYIITEYILFAGAGLIIAWFVSLPVFISVLLLFCMGIVYNVPPVRSKEIPYIDVLTESLNDALCLLIGWFILRTRFLPPVSIVFGYWMGGAFFMAAKRFTEYRMYRRQRSGRRISHKRSIQEGGPISRVLFAHRSIRRGPPLATAAFSVFRHPPGIDWE